MKNTKLWCDSFIFWKKKVGPKKVGFSLINFSQNCLLKVTAISHLLIIISS